MKVEYFTPFTKMQGYNYRNNSSYKRVKPRPWPWAVAPTNSRASPHSVLYCTVTISTVVLGSVQTSTPYPPPLLNTDWAPPKLLYLNHPPDLDIHHVVLFLGISGFRDFNKWPKAEIRTTPVRWAERSSITTST